MRGVSKRKLGVRALAGACLAGGYAIAFPQTSQADLVLNVGLANFSTTGSDGGASSNLGVTPITYNPAQVTVADAPSANYDAADTTDPGTIWNSIEGDSTVPSIASSGVMDVLFEQNLPLSNSIGASSGAKLNVYLIESNGKSDVIHTNHETAAGTDLLNPQPGNSTYGASLVGDGYTNSSQDQLLMVDDWITNGASEGFMFQVTGLTADIGQSFSLYVYGSGTSTGQGGTFSLASGNGNETVTTNNSATNRYSSVFSTNGGNNPTPELGLSWNELTGTVDSSGDVEFSELASGTGVKPGINGFQLDVSVPEPASVGLLAMATLGLLARRRKA